MDTVQGRRGGAGSIFATAIMLLAVLMIADALRTEEDGRAVPLTDAGPGPHAMISPDWVGGLGGGALIGLAVSLLLWLDGRIAGVSGILGGLLTAPGDRGWRLAFLAGLPLGAGLHAAMTGGLPQQLQGGWWLMATAGLLVGFGTRMGSGCTSGHGICGIARLSPRSVAATAVFMLTGILTVFLLRHVLP